MASNVYQRSVTFEDATATPTTQFLSDFVIALDYGGAEGLAPVVPIGATDVEITSIAQVFEDVQVTAPALADLNL